VVVAVLHSARSALVIDAVCRAPVVVARSQEEVALSAKLIQR